MQHQFVSSAGWAACIVVLHRWVNIYIQYTVVYSLWQLWKMNHFPQSNHWAAWHVWYLQLLSEWGRSKIVDCVARDTKYAGMVCFLGFMPVLQLPFTISSHQGGQLGRPLLSMPRYRFFLVCLCTCNFVQCETWTCLVCSSIISRILVTNLHITLWADCLGTVPNCLGLATPCTASYYNDLYSWCLGELLQL